MTYCPGRSRQDKGKGQRHEVWGRRWPSPLGPWGGMWQGQEGRAVSLEQGVAGPGLGVCRGSEGVFLQINSTESVLGAERGLCVSS